MTLDDPALAPLWDVVAERLQRNGLEVHGVVTLDGLDRPARFALAGLMGRPIDGGRVRIDLVRLDTRLRETGIGSGLVAETAARRGPLVNRPGERAAAATRRTAVWDAVRADLASSGLDAEPWVESWLQSIRPVVARVPASRVSPVLAAAVRCLARLPGDGPPRGRTELASAVVGSSHALDDGTVLAALVLRAVALKVDTSFPETPAGRRTLWARVGVLSDEVSTTVLTLGLRPPGDGVAATAVRVRSDAGCESHLTLRDLQRIDRFVAPRMTVWVCENPRVLEAAMDAGTGAAMVCTAGNPTLVVTMLLERLVAVGAAIRYRGDFDWPGVAIANRIIGAFGASPWRMSRADYDSALAAAGAGLVELPGLDGRPVDAMWDSELTAAMERAGRAVHEESLLEQLVGDLTG
ncbi:MAG TPA: TIGR02679 family protein [Acidimicrobiales bacterium]|nr:TIGR02679 family protein [Acidimicrobiales bacterium]